MYDKYILARINDIQQICVRIYIQHKIKFKKREICN